MELYKKHRPKTFKDLKNLPAAAEELQKMVAADNLPHALLISGPSGCGKTTIARILRRKLKCGEHDYFETNGAQARGIDDVRRISDRMGLAALGGKDCKRIYYIDECHKLTNEAQNALLKMLEDTPNHVYFFLATTEPNKVLTTVRNRCTSIVVKRFTSPAMQELLTGVLEKEGVELEDEVLEKIADESGGSARKALVTLERVIQHEDTESQLRSISDNSDEVEKKAIELAQALIQPKAKWANVKGILKQLLEQKEDPEGLRRMILGYGQAVVLGGGKLAPRAYYLIQAFRDPYYDIGAPGLVASCWEACHGEG